MLLLAASCLFPAACALLHSLPEDTHAFPKYRVAFLNEQPLLNETAERWLTQGLRGGELEFLDQSWKDDSSQTPPQRKEIGSADTPLDILATDSRSFATDNYTIEHMKLSPRDSYLCYIPKPSESASTRQQDETETDATPARSWSLLQPLSGTCLYHRQGWFTYSYCHNQAIRQFKELSQPQSRLPAGTFQPEEDPEWESYVLGRAPRSTEDTGADLTVAEQNAQAANLELARNAGSRYLVQRWGDGTMCDKTGKPREVEVQFHCSMVMTDHILFIKEAKTCSYVVVIHTPRLCGEPGFKSRRDSGEESFVRCREIVDALPIGQGSRSSNVLISDQPFKTVQRKAVLPPPPSPRAKEHSTSSSSGNKISKEIYNALLKQFVSPDSLREAMEDGEVVVEFIDDVDEELLEGSDSLAEILRAAGYDVRSEVIPTKEVNKGSDEEDIGSSSGASKKGRSEQEDSSSRANKERLQKVLQDHLEL